MKELMTKKEIHNLIGVKECTLCGDVKHLDKFYKRKPMRDGHRSECKTCSDQKRIERKNRQSQKNCSQDHGLVVKQDIPKISCSTTKEPLYIQFLNVMVGVILVFAVTYVILDELTK